MAASRDDGTKGFSGLSRPPHNWQGQGIEGVGVLPGILGAQGHQRSRGRPCEECGCDLVVPRYGTGRVATSPQGQPSGEMNHVDAKSHPYLSHPGPH